MQELKNMVISKAPNGEEANCSHLKLGDYVAITEAGLNEHNAHNMFNTVAIGAGVGVFALPAVIGGGIGLAMGGEAIGLGLLELGIIGGGTGATIGKVVDKPKTGHVVEGKHETLDLINMVGVVQRKTRRWWDQPGHDVLVRWYAKDEAGRPVRYEAWHNPEVLYGLTKV